MNSIFSKIERENMAKKYVPLVKKISNQYSGKSGLDYDEIEGFAWEGFVTALNGYDPSRSTMNFTSYAAYGIRNSILNGINTSSRTIQMSLYARNKAIAEGKEMPQAVKLSTLLRANTSDERQDDTCAALGVDDRALSQLGYDDPSSPDNPWMVLEDTLRSRFNDEWVNAFCETYGINGRKPVMGKDIAKRLNITPAALTRRNTKMINYIKSDADLCDVLSDMI